MPNSKRIAYVGSDAYKAGQTAGGLMGLFANKKADVAIISGSRNILNHEERIEGFKNVISKKYPNIHVECVAECFDDDYKAYEAIQNILIVHPSVNAFLFVAGGVYGGCKSIYQLTQRENFTVITFDLLEENIEFLKKDIIII